MSNTSFLFYRVRYETDVFFNIFKNYGKSHNLSIPRNRSVPSSTDNTRKPHGRREVFLYYSVAAETAASLPSKWTKEELDGLEKTLREHESWLSEWVEKQKSVRANQDPVIETTWTEMKARAKVLETDLHKL